MEKIINPCKCDVEDRNHYTYDAFVEIVYKNDILSLHGVIGPMISGNCRGSAGQCQDEIRKGVPKAPWTKEMVDKLCDIWDRWHLNDMRAGCEHQRALGWKGESYIGKPCPVCGYKYGTAWLKEEVPSDVIEWLESLPESEIKPAWI